MRSAVQYAGKPCGSLAAKQRDTAVEIDASAIDGLVVRLAQVGCLHSSVGQTGYACVHFGRAVADGIDVAGRLACGPGFSPRYLSRCPRIPAG
jgi:hypothetical protein